MNALTLRRHVSRGFRGIGYGIVVLQWFWILIVILPQLVEGGALDTFMPPSQPEPAVVRTEPPAEPNALTWVAVVAITAIVLTVTVLTLIRIPKTIAKSSDRIVIQTAQTVIPVITHHKPLPVKKRRELSRRIMLAVQLIAAALPVIISLFLPPFRELTGPIIVTLSLFMATFSLGCFLLAWLAEPKRKTKTRTGSA